MKIDAYLNINDDCVSIRSRESEDYGAVVAHKDTVTVDSPSFVVQPSGQEKVRETGVKNVHAFVRGEWDESVRVIHGEFVTYNPFHHDHFYHPDEHQYVESADRCLVTRKGIFTKGLSPIGTNE